MDSTINTEGEDAAEAVNESIEEARALEPFRHIEAHVLQKFNEENGMEMKVDGEALKKVAQLTFWVLENPWKNDLSQFMKHRGRKTLDADDAKLVFRRDPEILQRTLSMAQSLTLNGHSKPQKTSKPRRSHPIPPDNILENVPQPRHTFRNADESVEDVRRDLRVTEETFNDPEFEEMRESIMNKLTAEEKAKSKKSFKKLGIGSPENERIRKMTNISSDFEQTKTNSFDLLIQKGVDRMEKYNRRLDEKNISVDRPRHTFHPPLHTPAKKKDDFIEIIENSLPKSGPIDPTQLSNPLNQNQGPKKTETVYTSMKNLIASMKKTPTTNFNDQVLKKKHTQSYESSKDSYKESLSIVNEQFKENIAEDLNDSLDFEIAPEICGLVDQEKDYPEHEQGGGDQHEQEGHLDDLMEKENEEKDNLPPLSNSLDDDLFLSSSFQLTLQAQQQQDPPQQDQPSISKKPKTPQQKHPPPPPTTVQQQKPSTSSTPRVKQVPSIKETPSRPQKPPQPSAEQQKKIVHPTTSLALSKSSSVQQIQPKKLPETIPGASKSTEFIKPIAKHGAPQTSNLVQPQKSNATASKTSTTTVPAFPNPPIQVPKLLKGVCYVSKTKRGSSSSVSTNVNRKLSKPGNVGEPFNEPIETFAQPAVPPLPASRKKHVVEKQTPPVASTITSNVTAKPDVPPVQATPSVPSTKASVVVPPMKVTAVPKVIINQAKSTVPSSSKTATFQTPARSPLISASSGSIPSTAGRPVKASTSTSSIPTTSIPARQQPNQQQVSGSTISTPGRTTLTSLNTPSKNGQSIKSNGASLKNTTAFPINIVPPKHSPSRNSLFSAGVVNPIKIGLTAPKKSQSLTRPASCSDMNLAKDNDASGSGHRETDTAKVHTIPVNSTPLASTSAQVNEPETNVEHDSFFDDDLDLANLQIPGLEEPAQVPVQQPQPTPSSSNNQTTKLNPPFKRPVPTTVTANDSFGDSLNLQNVSSLLKENEQAPPRKKRDLVYDPPKTVNQRPVVQPRSHIAGQSTVKKVQSTTKVAQQRTPRTSFAQYSEFSNIDGAAPTTPTHNPLLGDPITPGWFHPDSCSTPVNPNPQRTAPIRQQAIFQKRR